MRNHQKISPYDLHQRTCNIKEKLHPTKNKERLYYSSLTLNTGNFQVWF